MDMNKVLNIGIQQGVQRNKLEVAKKLLDLYIMDQQAIQQYGYEQGIEQGIQQGVKQTKLDIAKKLLSKNMPIENIVELTGLTKEEIEKLKN